MHPASPKPRSAPGNASAALFGEVLESGHTLRELDLAWNQARGSCPGFWFGRGAALGDGRARSPLAPLNARPCTPPWESLVASASRRDPGPGPAPRQPQRPPPRLPGRSQIRTDGALGLARGLSANASLSRLLLAWNGLGDAGGGALGEALGVNLGLRWLDLSHCRLGDEVPAHQRGTQGGTRPCEGGWWCR
jgi:hypothetical protein